MAATTTLLNKDVCCGITGFLKLNPIADPIMTLLYKRVMFACQRLVLADLLCIPTYRLVKIKTSSGGANLSGWNPPGIDIEDDIAEDR